MCQANPNLQNLNTLGFKLLKNLKKLKQLKLVLRRSTTNVSSN